MLGAKDFMPLGIRTAYENGRNELKKAQAAFLKLHKKKQDGLSPEELRLYQELVKQRAKLHSEITALERHFEPLRPMLRRLGQLEID